MKMRLFVMLVLSAMAFEAHASDDPANAIFRCSDGKSNLYIVSSAPVSSITKGVTIDEGVTRISKFLADKAPDLYLVNQSGQSEKLNFIAPMGNGYPFGVWRGSEVDFDLLQDKIRINESLSFSTTRDSRSILIQRSTKKTMGCYPADKFRVDCC